MRGHLSLRQVRAPSMRQGDWSPSEKSELQRLDAVFPPPHYDIECNTTEEGDPWCVVYDCVQDGIAVHIARIDGQYAILRPVKGNTTSPRIKTVVDLAIQSLSTAKAFIS